MNKLRYRIPSSRALIAFEAVARLGGVGRAAGEMNTSQSAISRHLKQLEDELGVKLFDRVGRGLVLTYAGRTYLGVVSSALETLTAAAHSIRAATNDVTIACTHGVSHLLLMPVFGHLRQAVGEKANIRIMTCEYDAIPTMVHAGADIVFQYGTSPPGRTSVPVVTETITPVAAPSFVAGFQDLLGRPPNEWSGVPRLALSKNNYGWATWETWFKALDCTAAPAKVENYDDYVYLLEAATAGAGLALGWKGFVDRYIASGALVPVNNTWVSSSTKLYALRTNRGEKNENASKCLSFLNKMFHTSEPVDPGVL